MALATTIPVPSSALTPESFTPVGCPSVLIVSGDRLSRFVIQVGLQRQGYHVAGASNASDALDECLLKGDEIDVVLLDVGTVGLSGPAAVWMLRRLNPGIQVCVVTRDINPVQDEEFLDQGAAAVLHRPFSLSQLTDFLSLMFPFNPSLSPAA